MNKDNPSDASVQAEQNVPTGNGENENALGVNGNSAPLHEVLNEVLGTTYKSPEDAVRGMKETRDYVGKAGKGVKAVEAIMQAKGVSEDEAVKFIMDTVQNPTPEVAAPKVEAPKVEAPVNTGEFVSKAEFEKAMFYKDNPDLVPFSDILNSLATAQGKTLAEVSKLETFNQLLTAKKTVDETEKSKSALTSSPKLGQVTDKMTQAREAQKAGNQQAAEKSAVDAVLELMK